MTYSLSASGIIQDNFRSKYRMETFSHLGPYGDHDSVYLMQVLTKSCLEWTIPRYMA